MSVTTTSGWWRATQAAKVGGLSAEDMVVRQLGSISAKIQDSAQRHRSSIKGRASQVHPEIAHRVCRSASNATNERESQCNARRQLVKQTAALLDAPYTTRQATYDLRRLKRQGLILKTPHSHRYQLTPLGRRVAVLFIKPYGRVLAPGLIVLDPKLPGSVKQGSPPGNCLATARPRP
jgi:hypothetical protein